MTANVTPDDGGDPEAERMQQPYDRMHETTSSTASVVGHGDLGPDVMSQLASLLTAAQSYTNDPAIAEDLVRRTVQQGLDASRPERGRALRLWLHTRLVALCRHDSAGPAEPVDAVTTWPQSEDLDDRVATALRQLPETMRIAIHLSDVEGFSYGELAEILQLPVETAIALLHGGRRTILALVGYDRSVSQATEPATPC